MVRLILCDSTACVMCDLLNPHLRYASWCQARHGGAIVVDSTRRGKDFPDSLLKTIPIWCAVLNKVLFPACDDVSQGAPPVVAHHSVPPGEVSLIQAKMSDWVESLHGLCNRSSKIATEIQSLRTQLHKPLRPIWFRHGSVEFAFSSKEDTQAWLERLPYHPIVLLSASDSNLSREDFRHDGHR